MAPGIYEMKARIGGALGCAGLWRRRSKRGGASVAGLEKPTRIMAMARNTATTMGRAAGAPASLLAVWGPMALCTAAQALPSCDGW